MRAYVIRRVLLVVPTLLILSMIVFLLVRFIPGDVIDAMQADFAFTAGEIDREALERKLGLDQPIPVQYARWLGDIVLHGSLGQSLLGRFSVNEKIAGRLPVTIQLGVTALVIGLLIALPVGIYSAIRQDTTPDYVGRSVAVIGLATPNFWLALMVMLYPAIWWGWSPPMRLIRFSADLLGTDHVGRDLLTRLIYGARVSLTVGLAATALNVVVAMAIGGASGFVGGKVDLATQRFVDSWISIPGLLILLTIMSIVGQGLVQTIVVLGVTGGIGGSRVVRSAVIAIKENVYFQAAEAIGSSRWRTLVWHVVPNIVAPVIIVFSINIGAVIISEASLSFLGFGLPLEVPSWGGMLSREGREYMEQAPWLAFWPGIFLTVLVYSLNMFGDAVRDLLDPRLRGGGGRLGREPAKGHR